MKLIPLPQVPQPAMVHERKDYFTLPQLIDYANAVAEVKLQAANAQIEVLLEARYTRYPYYEQVGPVHVVCKCPKCADKDAARIFFRDQAEALRRQLDDQSNELSDARAGERKLIVENESLRAHYGLGPKS